MAIYDKIKDALTYITAITSIISLVLKFQTNLSLQELAFLLYFIGFGLLGLTIYLIYSHTILLVNAAMRNKRNLLKNILKILIVSIAIWIHF